MLFLLTLLYLEPDVDRHILENQSHEGGGLSLLHVSVYINLLCRSLSIERGNSIS